MHIDNLRLMTSARLVVVSTDATLRTAASALSNPHIGLIVVCDQNGGPQASLAIRSRPLFDEHGSDRSTRFHTDEPEHHLLPS